MAQLEVMLRGHVEKRNTNERSLVSTMPPIGTTLRSLRRKSLSALGYHHTSGNVAMWLMNGGPSPQECQSEMSLQSGPSLKLFDFEQTRGGSSVDHLASNP